MTAPTATWGIGSAGNGTTPPVDRNGDGAWTHRPPAHTGKSLPRYVLGE
ncbi:hypothetical protein MTX34_24330 [Rhodococcus sp. ARC_M5]|nr:hypothetical protein [Rhodococcus sp. ARC_M5]